MPQIHINCGTCKSSVENQAPDRICTVCYISLKQYARLMADDNDEQAAVCGKRDKTFGVLSLFLSLSLCQEQEWRISWEGNDVIVIPQNAYLFLGEERICEHAMRKYACLDAICHNNKEAWETAKALWRIRHHCILHRWLLQFSRKQYLCKIDEGGQQLASSCIWKKPQNLVAFSPFLCVKNKSEEFHNKIVISSLYLGRYVCCWEKKGFVSAPWERKFVLK
jgi:hypothetical protein